ncbi:MAG: hypothetical protein GF330_07410 [Candidatus Eisenbacteria bacterium]|nr:hypothetical protein [Candidatus Eisenbacteria bacterium]
MRTAALSLILLGSITLALGGWLARDLRPVPYWSQRVALARDLARELPSGEPVAAFWPGVFAQFSDRPIVPIDGVIGSADYFRDCVRPAREIECLIERGIRYLILWLPGELEAFLALPQMGPVPWPRLGMVRLWEWRDRLRIEERRTWQVDTGGGGWYLLELEPRRALPPRRSSAPGHR